MIIDIPDDIIIKNLSNIKDNIIIKYKEKTLKLKQKEFFYMIINFNKVKVIDYLIKKELLPIDTLDSDGRTILYNIIKFNYFETLKKIIEYNKKKIGISIQKLKDNKNNNSLFYTIVFNRFEMFEYMIKKGFDPYLTNFLDSNCFQLAIKLKRSKFINFLLDNYEDFSFLNEENETALYQICKTDQIKYFDKLLKKKIDINKGNKQFNVNPLIICVVNHKRKEFDKLINDERIDIYHTDKIGNTILHYVLIDGDYDFLIKIIEIFDNFNFQSLEGVTPFHLLIEKTDLFHKLHQNNNKLFNKFVDKTNFNLMNRYGETVAFTLLKNGLNDISLEIIKKKKINPLISNLEGNDIVDIVKNDPVFLKVFIDKYYKSLTKVELKDLEKWEKHCLEKNYKTLENDYNIKKYTKNLVKEEKCYEIIKRKILLKEKAFPIKKDRIIKIDSGIPLINCFYTASSIDILYGLIFLKNNLSGLDILIDYPLTSNLELEAQYKKLGIEYPLKNDFSNFEIYWFSISIFYPTYLEEKLIEFKNNKNKSRFVCIPISIEKDDKSHANMILIDTQNKEISRFEPHGSHSPEEVYFNEDLLDENLENKFLNIFENYTYLKPKNYLPKNGFQALENSMSESCQKIGDPNGFCAAWCVWWIYQRVIYSHFDIKTLVQKLINQIRIDKIDIPNMIRNFSNNNISKIRDETLKNNGIDINDWINSNYDTDMLNKIEKDSFNLIK